MYSLVIPIFNNEKNIAPLLLALEELSAHLTKKLEVVFVVDGSPDNSYLELKTNLSSHSFTSQLINLSRNFGAFSAIHMGLKQAQGKFIAVMAADLQEPPELIIEFFNILDKGSADITLGKRESRNDPPFSYLASTIFWSLYRRFVQPDIPKGGLDIFACTSQVRDRLCDMNEINSSLIGQLFWVGFKREEVEYTRKAREIGTSSWTFKKKLKYMTDSIFSFTDLPITILFRLGGASLILSLLLALIILISKILHTIEIPGYTATMMTILFFAALNSLGLAIVGSYAWRSYENTKQRPVAIISSKEEF